MAGRTARFTTTAELYDLLKKEGVPYEPNTGSTARSSSCLPSSSASRRPVACCVGAFLRGNHCVHRWPRTYVIALHTARRWSFTESSSRVLEADVLVHHLRPADGDLRRCERPHRHHVAVLGQRFGRVGLDRVGDEVVSGDCPDVVAIQARPLLASDTQQYALWYAPTWRPASCRRRPATATSHGRRSSRRSSVFTDLNDVRRAVGRVHFGVGGWTPWTLPFYYLVVRVCGGRQRT